MMIPHRKLGVYMTLESGGFGHLYSVEFSISEAFMRMIMDKINYQLKLQK